MVISHLLAGMILQVELQWVWLLLISCPPPQKKKGWSVWMLLLWLFMAYIWLVSLCAKFREGWWKFHEFMGAKAVGIVPKKKWSMESFAWLRFEESRHQQPELLVQPRRIGELQCLSFLALLRRPKQLSSPQWRRSLQEGYLWLVANFHWRVLSQVTWSLWRQASSSII